MGKTGISQQHPTNGITGAMAEKFATLQLERSNWKIVTKIRFRDLQLSCT